MLQLRSWSAFFALRVFVSQPPHLSFSPVIFRFQMSALFGLLPSTLQDTAKAMENLRDARAAQRHAELWLEKSLAEVDAVHAILEYSDRTALRAAATGGCAVLSPAKTVELSTQTPNPPSPDFARMGVNSGEGRQQETHTAVGPGAQTPRPPSPAIMRVGASLDNEGRAVPVGGGHFKSPAGSQISPIRTPDQRDTTMPLLFSASKRLGSSAVTERGWKEENDCIFMTDYEIEQETGTGGCGSRARFNSSSPPTPTVLFEDVPIERRRTCEEGQVTMSSSHKKVYLSPNGVADEKTANTELESKVDNKGNAPFHRLAVPGASNGHTPSEKNGMNVAINGQPGGTDSKAASLLLWHSFFLRYEMNRREKAEARAAQLEIEVEHAAIEKAATSGGGPVLAGDLGQVANPFTSKDTVSGSINDARQRESCRGCACGSGGHHSLTLPGATNTSDFGATADCYTHFAQLDQDRQKDKIVNLVHEARSKMNMSGKEVKDEAGAGSGPGSWVKRASINDCGRGRGLPGEKGCV